MNYCFIDFNNLYLGIKRLGWKIDYKRFYIYLKESYKISKVFVYLGYLKKYEPKYRELKSIGYSIVFKDTMVVQKIKKVKANVDVHLTVDAIRKLNEYSTGIFISADGDFCPLYDYLLDMKKSIVVIVPDIHRYSRFLRKYGNRVFGMNNLRNKISIKNGSFDL
ncbi:NYN domain-containing protein [Candidatus Dojkabacteria bacterium]|jgi:uncharacterized LabA/DUF88 family protein|nr:NYN domain-containing protein [Candidatus Dojkabacteria bacterium]